MVAGLLARLTWPWTSLLAGKARPSSWAPLPWATTAPSLAIAYRLIANLIRIALVTLALAIGLGVVGINLTAFTVFSGACRRHHPVELDDAG